MLRLFKKKENQSIRRTMLTSNLFTMLLVLSFVTVIFSTWQLNNIKKNIEDNLQQTLRTVILDVDKEIQRMDTVSINILYSNLVKNTFARYVGYSQTDSASTHSDYARNTSAEQLTNLMIAIMGADRPVRQVNLYNSVSGCFGTGLFNGYIDENAPDMPWYSETVSRGGYRYIPMPEKKPLLSRESGANSDKLYLSLTRQFYNTYNQPEGLVEILQYYDVVFSSAINPESSYEPQVIIFNQSGNVVFPYESAKKENEKYLASKSKGLVKLRNPVSTRQEYAMFGDMSYAGFTVAVVIDRAKYFAPITQFVVTMILTLVGVTVICCVTAYYVTRRLSSPIVGMYSYLRGLDFDSKDEMKIPAESSGILEIDVLRETIVHFQKRLHVSMENNILLQKQEMQAQMLALQSQMDPHFLYNSLATISAMAEEGMTQEISEVCSNITTILRYISSNRQQLAPLEDELDNAYRYLSCLKLRFGDALSHSIEVPDEMLGVLVPKLCVQLLVENAVKFTSKTPPPWKINICSKLENGSWQVTVSDNGSGFSDEATTGMRAKINEINEFGLLPSLELDGMGLLNIYIRLYLLNEGRHIFEFGNRNEGGASVTIGGILVEQGNSL